MSFDFSNFSETTPSYNRLVQDAPVDKYLQQHPRLSASDVVEPSFFSLFLHPDFPSDPMQIPNNAYNNPLKQAKKVYEPMCKINNMDNNNNKKKIKEYSSPELPNNESTTAACLEAVKNRKKKRRKPTPATEIDEHELVDLPEDERQKQRRLMKNRKAAQQFRRRQKSHIIELEDQVEKLSSENGTLGAKVELLTTENKLIKEQLEYMRSFVMNALQISFPANTSLQDVQQLSGILNGTSTTSPTSSSSPSSSPSTTTSS